MVTGKLKKNRRKKGGVTKVATGSLKKNQANKKNTAIPWSLHRGSLANESNPGRAFKQESMLAKPDQSWYIDNFASTET